MDPAVRDQDDGRVLMGERRRDPRVIAGAAGISARLRPGGDVCLVDVCRGGALVQTARQVRPGALVQLLLTSATGRASVAAHVVRSAVASLHPTEGALYWGALQFTERIDWP